MQQWGADIHVFVELWGNRWVGGAWLNSIRSSEEVVVLWDKRTWKGEFVDSGVQMLTCKYFGINQDISRYLTAVYAECERMKRKKLWWELAAIFIFCVHGGGGGGTMGGMWRL